MTSHTPRTLGDALPPLLMVARSTMLELHEHANPGLAACVALLEEAMQACDIAMVTADLAAMVQAYAHLDNLLRTIAVTRRLAQ